MCSGEYFILIARPFLIVCLYWGFGDWHFLLLFMWVWQILTNTLYNFPKNIGNKFRKDGLTAQLKKSKKKAISVLKKQFLVSNLKSARGTEMNQTANFVLIKEYSHFQLENFELSQC